MNEYQQTIQNMLMYDGPLCPDHQWLLSPFDSWHENPYYEGPDQPHPEYDRPEEEDETIEERNARVAGPFPIEVSC